MDMSEYSQMTNQMEGQRLFEQYSNVPYQQFSAQIFEKELHRLISVFGGQGKQLISYIEQIDTEFNVEKIKQIVKKSKSSAELVQNLKPYLEKFQRFANELFPSITQFFKEIENSEAILHGFQFRFMLDLATIFTEATKRELYLLNEDSDFSTFERLTNKLFKEINFKSRTLALNSMKATPKQIEQEIKNSGRRGMLSVLFLSHANKRGFLSKQFSAFIQEIRDDVEQELRRKPFVEFDRTRILIYNDIMGNSIKLDFIKKLQEYITYLELIEAQIFNIENKLMYVFIEFNRKILNINQKISEFINYIVNEKEFSNELKSMVKGYLQKSDEVEQSINGFHQLEQSIQERVQQLDAHLVALLGQFKQKIKEYAAQNQQHAEQILRNRL